MQFTHWGENSKSKLPREEPKINFCHRYHQAASWMWTCLHWHMGTGLNPFPPTGSLCSQLFTYKHTLCCRPRLPKCSFMWAVWACLSPGSRVSWAALHALGCWEPDGGSQAAGQPGESQGYQRAGACQPALPAAAGPAHWAPHHPGAAGTQLWQIPNGCTIAAPHSQKCCHFLKPS